MAALYLYGYKLSGSLASFVDELNLPVYSHISERSLTPNVTQFRNRNSDGQYSDTLSCQMGRALGQQRGVVHNARP
jgi:hypothetical protein